MSFPPPFLRATALAPLCALLLAGCDYAVPLTSAPTRPVDPRLLGGWVGVSAGQERDRLGVWRWDDATYLVVLNGDAFRAHHSDVGGEPFVSVQDLKGEERKFSWYRWSLSADGAQLTLEGVDDGVVPDEARDPESARRLLEARRGQPGWLEEPVRFVRESRS